MGTKRTRAIVAVVIAIAVLVLLIAGCGGGAQYPASVGTQFVNNCVNSGQLSPSGCQCALQWLEQHVQANGFAQAESAAVEPGWAYDDRQYAMAACAPGP